MSVAPGPRRRPGPGPPPHNNSMHAPTYRWRCHKCELVNVPSMSSCAHCDFQLLHRRSRSAAREASQTQLRQAIVPSVLLWVGFWYFSRGGREQQSLHA